MGLAKTWSVSASASCAAEAWEEVEEKQKSDGEVVSFMGKISGKHMEKHGENIETYMGTSINLENIREDDGKSWDVAVKNFDETPEIVIA